ncbi:MAG TPA: lactonase family protein [Anaerolineales bacterium]
MTSEEAPVVFVGTYTEHKGSESKGIYVYQMDPASGKLSLERAVEGIPNPSYLDFHPRLNLLYAVNELQDFAGEKGGGVSALSIDSDPRVVLNHQPSHGTDPCHISVEQTGQFALVANYSSGSAAVFPIQADGRLGPATDIVQHSGSSVHPERQAGPHAHCILPDPTNRFAIVVDLGLDKFLVYEMDLERGRLNKYAEVEIRAGAGPRHLTFHPSRKLAYLVNELNATLIGYRYDTETGSFEELQTVPALPDDFTGENLCAAIKISPDGKFIYASNRGHDSIVCFQIDENTGLLSYRSHASTGGKEPRDFAIDPSGHFLLAANQKSNTIVVFRIDAKSGDLSRTGHEVEISMPVCLKFVPLRP